MRRIAVLATIVATIGAQQAGAVKYNDGIKDRYSHTYFAAAGRCHDREAVGRNVRRDGIRDGVAASRSHYARSMGVLRRMCRPRAPVMTNMKSATQPIAKSSYHGGDGTGLDAIARCESGGNPRAISPGGTYRGKYQFDSGTWASVGGSGDPAAAPEAEQDKRAAMLHARSGNSPWPICGR